MNNNWESRLRAACNQIASVLAEAKKEYPQAKLFLDDGGSLNLLSGPAHDDHDTVRSHPEREICSIPTQIYTGEW